MVAQAHTGPSGSKQAVRRAGGVSDSFNGAASRSEDQLAAAALVADRYLLFLLGPMLLAGAWATPQGVVGELSNIEEIEVHGEA
ncbi:MAG: hypothetical protein JWO24_136 [Rhodospirillales bacterium]|nr:hypothetical protein [Rhodospirillales bacterium]